MKKIFLLIMIFISAKVFGQFPSEQSMGSPKTQVYSKGSFGSDSGFIYRSCFTDTIQANRGFMKNIPGIKIRTCDDNEWMRNNTAVKWILTGSSSGFINPMTTFGDKIVAENFGVPVREAQTELNAKLFGVVGNGVADDTDSLEAFFNYCVTNGLSGVIPPGIYKTTRTLHVGDPNPSFTPYKQVSVTIRGSGVYENTLGNGTLIYHYGTGDTAIISLEKGLSRGFRLKDMKLENVTDNGTIYGLLFNGNIFSDFEINNVFAFHPRRAFGMKNLTSSVSGTNGEFVTFIKCHGYASENFFYMDTLTGQGFNHLFIHCLGNVADGGAYFEIGDNQLGYGLTAIEFNSSTINTSTNGVTFFKNKGTSGTFNFIGGRQEGVTTILHNVSTSGTYNNLSKIVFKGMSFVGMSSTVTNEAIKSSGQSNALASYSISMEDCWFDGGSYTTAYFRDSIGVADSSLYKMTRCTWTSFNKLDSLDIYSSRLSFEDCQRRVSDAVAPRIFTTINPRWTPVNIVGNDNTGGVLTTAYQQNLQQGVGITANGIRSIGTNSDIDFNLLGKGSGGHVYIGLDNNNTGFRLSPNDGFYIGNRSFALTADAGNTITIGKSSDATIGMRINTTSGFVGIGTTSASAKLDLNGTSIFRDSSTFTRSGIAATGGKVDIANSSVNRRNNATELNFHNSIDYHDNIHSAQIKSYISDSANQTNVLKFSTYVNGTELTERMSLSNAGVKIFKADSTAAPITFLYLDPTDSLIKRAIPAGGGGGGTVTSVSGTTNRITSTGGATPVIDISSSYVGQSSITTHGTITNGGLGTGAVIGGVTMTLGSDATGDLYYRNGSGVLTRMATGTSKQALHPNGSGAYVWRDTVTLDFDSIGDYTPTLYNTTNVTTSTAYPTMWQTQGGGIRITVTGQVLVDPTSTGAVVLGIEIPFATSLSQNYSLNGVAVSEITGEPAYVTADVTNNRALLQFTATSTASRTYKITFTYDYAPS